MGSFIKALILSFNDSYQYLNRLPVKYWLPFLLSCLFLGWNGLQIILTPNLLLAFINTRSVTDLVYTTLEYHLRSIPIYVFIVTSFIIMHWLIHSFFEAGFTQLIHKQKLKLSRIYGIGMNFFVPNLLIVITIFFLVAAIFILSVFLQIAFSGFAMTVITGFETLIYRVIGLSFFLSIIATMWLTDYVLPRMAMGETFRHAFLRSVIVLNNRPFSLISFYIIKLVLIILSVYLFQIILRHFFLPFFVMLEAQYSIIPTLVSGRNLVFQKMFSNLALLIVMFLSALIVFAPFMAPLYLFQRYLLFRLYKV